MFCKNCGAAMADDARFCMGCGTPVDAPAQPAQPVAPTQPAQPAAPAQTATAADPVASVKKIMHFIVAGIATLALILAIMNLFGLGSVNVSIELWGRSYDTSVGLSALYDGEGTTFLMLMNILYGLISLGIAGAGVLYFLKGLLKLDLYDKFVGKFANGLLGKIVSGDGILTLIGALGATFGILQLLGYLTAGPEGASVGMPFLSWMMLIIYIGIACADIFWIGKKQK